jgi:hypothetical protein
MAAPGTEVRYTDSDLPAIMLGSKGDNVKLWQSVLGLPQTGTFDETLDRATRTWQAGKGITADGIVGPLTWGASGVKNRVQPAGFDIKTAGGVASGVAVGAAFGGPVGALLGGGAMWLGRKFWRGFL